MSGSPTDGKRLFNSHQQASNRSQSLERAHLDVDSQVGHSPATSYDAKQVSSLLTLVSGGFLFSGSCPVNASRTLAVSPARSGATDRRRAGEDAAVQLALRVRQLRKVVVVVFQAKPFQARFGHQPDQVFAHAVAAVCRRSSRRPPIKPNSLSFRCKR